MESQKQCWSIRFVLCYGNDPSYPFTPGAICHSLFWQALTEQVIRHRIKQPEELFMALYICQFCHFVLHIARYTGIRKCPHCGRTMIFKDK
jgi:DNA-directed RNA polymerase subunit RPC12/RpoP